MDKNGEKIVEGVRGKCLGTTALNHCARVRLGTTGLDLDLVVKSKRAIGLNYYKKVGLKYLFILYIQFE